MNFPKDHFRIFNHKSVNLIIMKGAIQSNNKHTGDCTEKHKFAERKNAIQHLQMIRECNDIHRNRCLRFRMSN